MIYIYHYIGTVNKADDTPLSLACTNGHLDTVKYLVNECHCDPRSKHSLNIFVTQYTCIIIIGTVNKAGDTDTSLFLACANGHLDIVKFLANECHCDPKSKFYHCTCVCIAFSN